MTVERTLSLHHVVREHDNSDGSRPPLLILLHGVGANERQMAAVAPGFDTRLLVLSVRSPITLAADSYGWFHVTFTADGPQIDAAEACRGWETMAAFIREAVDAYAADPKRVWLGGFSQGGIMSLATLLTSPQLVSGAICMSGRLLPEVLPHAAPVEWLSGKPVFLLHGTKDTRLGIHFAHSAREKLTGLGVKLTYREFDIPHTMTEETIAAASAWLTERLDERSAGTRAG